MRTSLFVRRRRGRLLPAAMAALLALTAALAVALPVQAAASATIENPGFETGDLTGWTVTEGDAFTDPHVSDATGWGWGCCFNPEGTYHLWGAATGGDAPTGRMRSSVFTLGGIGEISFLLGGGNNPENLYVALRRASDDAELMRATNTAFADSERLARVVWRAQAHLGEELYLEVVDTASGGWGHLNLDDVRTYAEESIDPLEPVVGHEFDNPGFESGDLAGWTADGPAFAGANVSGETTTPDGVAFGADGAYHLWGGGDEGLTGTLTSDPFLVGGRGEVWLLLGGTKDPGVYVAVYAAEDGRELARAGVDATRETYEEVVLDLSAHEGEQVELRLVDGSTTGHLNADHVRTLVNDPMHWSFDEGSGKQAHDDGSDVTDDVAYVFNDALDKPDSDPLWREGVRGGSLLFDGYSTYLRRDGRAALTPSSGLSVEAWVAPRSYEWGDRGQASAIVNQHDAAAKAGYLLGMYRHGAWGLELGDGVGWHTLRAPAGATLPTYGWSHVAATYDAASGVMRLYLNGDEVATKKLGAGTRILAAAGQPLQVGRHNQAAVINGTFHANSWNGAIDELTVTDEVRTAEQIAGAAAGGGDASTAGLRPDRSRYDGDRYRPQYHFLPPEHWMNEPHAPLWYDGKYHIFYQHNPQGPYWHQIHWGHAVSTDLVHWKDLPVAIAPQEPVTPDGVWSGSATTDADGKPVLFYTAGNDAKVPNQATGLAWPAPGTPESPLADWRLEPEPVTVQQQDLSSPVGTPWFGQFRDPFVWQETGDDGKPVWYQIVGSGIVDGEKKVGGTALVYTSRDLLHWEYRNPLFVGDAARYPKTGQVWELPVLLPLGERGGEQKHVLVVNPWFDGYSENTAKNTYYWVGEWDRDEHRFVPDHEEPRLFDHGEHFTGPSGMVDPKGRSLLFTITQDGRSESDHHDAGWAHSMGLPVELNLTADGDAGVTPVKELRSLRSEKVVSIADASAATTNAALGRKQGRLSDLLEVKAELRIRPGSGSGVGLELRRSGDGRERTVLTADRAGKLRLDRNFSSLDPDTRKGVHEGALEIGADGKVTMHVYVDRSVVEAFVGGGRSMTTRVYPTLADAVGLRVVGGTNVRVRSLEVWNLDGAYGPVVPAHHEAPPAPGPGVGELPNGDFETCDLTGWTVVDGDAYGDANVTDADDWGWGGPFRQANAWGSTDRCHLWGFDEAVGDAGTGRLRSETFTLGGDGAIDLLTAGGHDPDKLYVALVRAADGEVLAKVSGNAEEALRAQYQRRHLDASEYVGEEVYVEIVDEATGGWGHLSVDDVNVPVSAG
ncbi:LamG-like jellyroll fold domain-containing protein [Myceligenerans crystallogenes]|uniref:beta-fructofuranosidase n=1 Tax=Myceligenerans crystallogenes TaxID=316335 RepID=A0ABP4ZVN1_9MICO